MDTPTYHNWPARFFLCHRLADTLQYQWVTFSADCVTFADLRQLHCLDLDGVEYLRQSVLPRLQLLLVIDDVEDAKVCKIQPFLLNCFVLYRLQRIQLSDDLLVLSIALAVDFRLILLRNAFVMCYVPNPKYCWRGKNYSSRIMISLYDISRACLRR